MLTLGAEGVRAAFVAPAWSRNAAYTTYQGWDVFADPAGPNNPNNPGTPPFGPFVDAAPFNGNGTANVVDTSGQSFVPGSGNLYSPSAPLNVRVTVPDANLGSGYVTTVLFQTRTAGSEPVYAGAGGYRLTYTDGGGTHTVFPFAAAESDRTLLGGRGGTQVDYTTVFRVPASASLLTILLDGASSSLSLDRVSVDTITTRGTAASTLLPNMNPTVGFVNQAVPEPGVAGMAVLGAIGTLIRRTRRTH